MYYKKKFNLSKKIISNVITKMLKLMVDKLKGWNRMNINNMKIEEVVEKINVLYRLSQERELTQEEKEMQGQLRQRYINNVKRNFRAQLESIELKK